MDKKINYLARDFKDIKSELIKFSKTYYPELSDNYNDASVGSWFIDLVSAVGDNLSYHTDRMYQENNLDSANLKSSVINAAKLNGVKIPGPKASMCEIELSCTLPIDDGNISQPKWSYAPIIKMGSIVGNTDYYFELSEDVNFQEQFNSDGVSNRTFYPLKDNNGSIIGYNVSKTAVVIGGVNKIYKKVLSNTDVKPFMEIILPEKNIMNIESIIFKEDSSYGLEPKSYEYYIDAEEFKTANEQINTFRFFEVDSLSDQWRFGVKQNIDDEKNIVPYQNNVYVDYTETEGNNSDSSKRTSRYFKGEWKAITQKFITEYTDNGYLKIIFGSGTTPEVSNDENTPYYKHIMTKIMNNDLLGVLPKVGWTMFVLYRTGGGAESNLSKGAINTIINANTVFTNNDGDKTSIVKSLKVTNISPSVCGKDAPSVEEIKYLTKYSIPEQKRCVTLKDYKSKILQMPPKYGCPFRINSMEDNNKVILSCLGLNSLGKLDSSLPETMKDNMIEYLKHYKTLGDYVEINSGKIYNIGFEIDVFIDKNYTPSDVIKNIINITSEYFNIKNHDMGEDIFIGNLEKDINLIDGVISLIDLRCYALYGGEKYSPDICPLPKNNQEEKVNNSESLTFEINLRQTDGVLYSDFNSMYEVKFPESDIKIKYKLK